MQSTLGGPTKTRVRTRKTERSGEVTPSAMRSSGSLAAVTRVEEARVRERKAPAEGQDRPNRARTAAQPSCHIERSTTSSRLRIEPAVVSRATSNGNAPDQRADPQRLSMCMSRPADRRGVTRSAFKSPGRCDASASVEKRGADPSSMPPSRRPPARPPALISAEKVPGLAHQGHRHGSAAHSAIAVASTSSVCLISSAGSDQHAHAMSGRPYMGWAYMPPPE